MRSQLYLWEPEREQKKEELAEIKKLYFEKIEPIFANAEQDAKQYQNDMWDDLLHQPCSGESDYIDPGIFAEQVQEAGINGTSFFL